MHICDLFCVEGRKENIHIFMDIGRHVNFKMSTYCKEKENHGPHKI